MKNIRVGIADDHPVVTMGAEFGLRQTRFIDVEFVCWDIETLFLKLASVAIDVLVCDYEFADDPLPDGLQLVARLRRAYPSIKLLLLSSHTSAPVVSSVINLGASGFVGKSQSDFSNLANVVRDVNAGRLFVPPSIASSLLQITLTKSTSGLGRLSDKELTVARLTAKGMSLQEIANRLNRSVKTISNQKVAAMRKLGVRNDAELVSVLRELQ